MATPYPLGARRNKSPIELVNQEIGRDAHQKYQSSKRHLIGQFD
jgi:hypothetical protein